MILKMQGYPIRIVDWSESSQIVTIISDKYGKISGVAKGARRLKSPFDGPFDYLNRYELLMVRRPGQRLGTWTESYLFDRPEIFRKSLAAQYTGLSCLERCRELLEDEENVPIFDDLNWVFGQLKKEERQPLYVHNVFSLRLLSYAGYAPVTEYCVGNGRPKTQDSAVPFSPLLGGILCPMCVHLDPDVAMMSKEEVYFIRKVQEGRLPEAMNSKETKSLNYKLTLMIQHILSKGLRLSPLMSRMVAVFLICFLVACGGGKENDDKFYYEKGVASLEADEWFFFGGPFDELYDNYPESPLVADSYYVFAKHEQQQGEASEMRDHLLDLLEAYPTYPKYEEVLQQYFDSLKAHFLENKEDDDGREVFNVSLLNLNNMMRISAFAPYSEMSDEALMMVADTKLGRQDFDEAEEIYRDILSRLDKKSPFFVEAQYKLALSLWDRAVVRIIGFFSRYLRNPMEPLSDSDRAIAVRYSDRFPIEAEIEFKELIRNFKGSKRARDAEKILAEIEQLKMFRFYEMGRFYEFYNRPESAIYYYRKVGANSAVASEALEREADLLEKR